MISVLLFIVFVLGVLFGFGMSLLSFSFWEKGKIIIPWVVMVLIGNAVGMGISILLIYFWR